ncbi:MAG: hypothetical protein MZW92_77385 [Comamonadaceae bacterium]|nr:hypothetical protein [Comamonadaceae bacterium]
MALEKMDKLGTHLRQRLTPGCASRARVAPLHAPATELRACRSSWPSRRHRSSSADRRRSRASTSSSPLAVVLLVADLRFHYLEVLRQALGGRRLPAAAASRTAPVRRGARRHGSYFATQSRPAARRTPTLQAPAGALRRTLLRQRAARAGERAACARCSTCSERAAGQGAWSPRSSTPRATRSRARSIIDKGCQHGIVAGQPVDRRQRRDRPGDARVPAARRGRR